MKTTKTVPQHPYFNVQPDFRFYETFTGNLYDTIITSAKVYDVAILKHEPKLRNSTEFVRDVASYEL